MQNPSLDEIRDILKKANESLLSACPTILKENLTKFHKRCKMRGMRLFLSIR